MIYVKYEYFVIDTYTITVPTGTSTMAVTVWDNFFKINIIEGPN